MISASKLSVWAMLAVAVPKVQSFQTVYPRAASLTVSSRTPVRIAPPAFRASKRGPLMARLTDDEQRDLPDKSSVHNNNFLRQLSKLRPVLLSLSIFLLPLFLSMPSWAVQSGGRIGGSVGGGTRSSGGYSRSYSSGGGGGYSRGFTRGYTSGYYSRPSVVVSPGITPYYR